MGILLFFIILYLTFIFTCMSPYGTKPVYVREYVLLDTSSKDYLNKLFKGFEKQACELRLKHQVL